MLDATGRVVETGSTWPGEQSESTYVSMIALREWVDALPAEFVEVLGTERVAQEIDG